jgi:hypothetical protein
MVAVLGAILVGVGSAATAGAAVGVTAGVIGGVVVAGAVAGVAGSVKAGKAGKAAVQIQQKAAKLTSKRQRRAAIRSNMIATARARASAQAAGTSQSSGLSGAVGSGRSQLSGALGYSTQQSGLSSQVTALGQKQAKYSQIGDLGFKALGYGLSAGGQAQIGGAIADVTGPMDLFGGSSWSN